MSEQDKRSCNLICIMSIVFMVVPMIADAGVSIINAFISANTSANIAAPLFGFTGMFQLTAIILMIVARVKFPQSVFAKVLMWVYIALVVLAIIFTILAAILLIVACSACSETLSGCPGMVLPIFTALLG
ncbi:MAG: hypothetical protein MJ094_06475 [Saccharofermentans sp.]|nr:hypothetical protein [Saccharofermentans sp.]